MALDDIGFDLISLERDQPGEEHIVILVQRKPDRSFKDSSFGDAKQDDE